MSRTHYPGGQARLTISAGAPRRPRSAPGKKPVPELPEALGTKLWLGDFQGTICALSDEELKAATARMSDDLFRGKTPAPKDKKPHIIMTIGGPGSGKSTVAKLCAEDMGAYPYADYVNIDFDTLVKYHPRVNDIWSVPDMLGRPTGVGYADGWWKCGTELFQSLADKFIDDAMAKHYNLIVQTHWQPRMISAQLDNYFCTFLYVAAPLAVAQRRARARAIETGMFLTATLAAQDDVVRAMWEGYRRTTPWYALWADEFVAVANGVDGKAPAKGDFFYVDVHELVPWKAKINHMYTLMAVVHGEIDRSALWKSSGVVEVPKK